MAAESWEKYHTEGAKGFSRAFQEVLEQITQAFKAVYKGLTGEKLTPELRQMFDEILGKEAPKAAEPPKIEGEQVKPKTAKEIAKETNAEKAKKVSDRLRAFADNIGKGSTNIKLDAGITQFLTKQILKRAAEISP